MLDKLHKNRLSKSRPDKSSIYTNVYMSYTRTDYDKLYDDVVVMIPTLNEAGAIGKTIKDVQDHVPGCRIVVVDSYSGDGTGDIATKTGATVVLAPRGGKGLAVRSALPGILSQDPCSKPFAKLVMIDGDFTYPALYIQGAVRFLDTGSDVVMGYRSKREPGAMSRINVIGNWGLSVIAGMVSRMMVKDVCTGLWGFRVDALKRFQLTGDKFTLEADLFTQAVRTKCKIKQMPIGYRARLEHSVTHLGVRDGLDIAAFLVKERFRS